MPAELVEEFPEGHKEAAERHEDSEDSPDWTEPMLLEMRMKENSLQDLRKSDGEADDIPSQGMETPQSTIPPTQDLLRP